MDNDSKFLLKNFINKDKSRLQSFKPNRDFSLGGSKPAVQKKVYAPNLNAVRNKDKTKEIVKKNEQKRKERSKFSGQNHNKQRYVQSSGVFSEGTCAKSPQTTEKRVRYRESNDHESPAMTRPTIKKDKWEVDKKEEDSVYDDIMGVDDASDDEKMSFTPITWCGKDLKEIAPKLAIKTEDIKDEIDEDHFSKLNIQTMYHIPDDLKGDDFISDYNPNLTIWNLPDSFAGKGLSDEPNDKQLHDYSLDDMVEGSLGKVCIRKSGKIEVHIGSVIYNLEASNLSTLQEEVISIQDNQTERSKSAVLGQIQNRYTLNPDWESLLL